MHREISEFRGACILPANLIRFAYFCLASLFEITFYAAVTFHVLPFFIQLFSRL